MSKERLKQLKEEVSQIGHNLGPPLLEKEEKLRAEARNKLTPETEFKKFAVILDMMGSHVRGERLLSDVPAAYVAVGLMIVAGFTGVGIGVSPITVLAGDVAVLGLVYATLREEIEAYIQWRRKEEPEYASGAL